MKQTFSAITLVAFLAIVLTASCNKIGELCFDFAQNTTIATNAVTAPGPVTSTKSLGTALTDQLTSKGVKIENVNTVSVKAITITIPATAGYTFDDISTAEVTVNNISLGKLPAGAAGLTATFSTPSQGDFKTAFLSGTGAIMIFNATFKKAVAASSLNVQIPLNTCYQVL
jgi:hypothetical protein